MVNVPLLAVEVAKNSVKPPPTNGPLTAPPLVVKVPLPAVEVPLKSVSSCLPTVAKEPHWAGKSRPIDS
jgi:hypothetical protein